MQGICLAMYGNEVSIGSAIFISIFAMLIVFVVLLLISFMIDITAAVLNVGKKKTAVSVVNDSVNVEKKNDKAVDVAVIAAAVAAYLGTSVDNIKIKKIRRGNANMFLWKGQNVYYS